MNKNVIVVGAIAVGLYLLSQQNKPKKAVVKKKAPRRPPRKHDQPHPYPKPKIKRVIAKKKAVYNKPRIIKATRGKKKVYNKPRIIKATRGKKATYKKHIPRVAIAKKRQLQRIIRRLKRR